MDLAPWCYSGLDGWDWISPGGVRYTASYGASNVAVGKER